MAATAGTSDSATGFTHRTSVRLRTGGWDAAPSLRPAPVKEFQSANWEVAVKGTIRIGRVAGIPVSAHLSVLILIVLAAAQLAVSLLPELVPAGTGARWVTAGIFAVLFAGTLLAHEFAHASLARRFGVRVEGITLWMFGGVTKSSGSPPTPGKAAAIAAIGPAVSVGLAVSSYCLAGLVGSAWLSGLPAAGLVWLGVLNLFLVALNLLPGTPLDGGRLLQAWLWHRSKDWTRATAASARSGVIIATGLLAFGAVTVMIADFGDGLMLTMVAFFLVMAIGAEQKRAGTPVRDVPAGQTMAASPVFAPGSWTVEAFVRYLVTWGNPDYLFLVRDNAGSPIGVADRADLFGVEPSRRATVHMRDIAHPMYAKR